MQTSNSIAMESAASELTAEQVVLASHEQQTGTFQVDLLLPGMHCAACLQRIEKGLGDTIGVSRARVNLGAKTVAVQYGKDTGALPVLLTLRGLGFEVRLPASGHSSTDPVLAAYLKALAVAGFAASNIMLFSVSIWSGADAATRELFHWISLLIAVPALLYSARVFYLSAWRALRNWQTNMDVPISVGIALTCALGIYDTITHGEQVYFESSTMLVFFLLIGRTLDHLMRRRAAQTLDTLAQLEPAFAQRIEASADSVKTSVALGDVSVGDLLQVDAGQRMPVDGQVESGRSELDVSLLTGESEPQLVHRGSQVQAGTLNLSSVLTIRASATAANSFLATTRALLAAAGCEKGKIQGLADRAARYYSPVVHLLAAFSLLGWYLATADLHRAVTIAVAVLIITCPCAFGLAVPMVQVMAGRRLLDRGVVMKNGAALERLQAVNSVVFDKTGTLTTGLPILVNRHVIKPEHLQLARIFCEGSTHPYSKSLLREQGIGEHSLLADHKELEVEEIAGMGREAKVGPDCYRLGRPEWALANSKEQNPDTSRSRSVLSLNGEWLTTFLFADELRAHASESIAELRQQNLALAVLSGDEPGPVSRLATPLNFDEVIASATPAEKANYVQQRQTEGDSVLMVGDGLNDSIAMAEAWVSMAPSTAGDAERQAADFVFLQNSLQAVPLSITVARRAHRLAMQNFSIAVVYNLLALPFAILGYITPLIAALAMSTSSILVVANALRLRADKPIVERAEPVEDSSAMPETTVASNR